MRASGTYLAQILSSWWMDASLLILLVNVASHLVHLLDGSGVGTLLVFHSHCNLHKGLSHAMRGLPEFVEVLH